MPLSSCGPVPFALAAVASAAAFTGVGFHLTLVDGPIAEQAGAAHGVQHFRGMYPLVKNYQISLALLSGVSSAVASVLSTGVSRYFFAAGALLTPLVIPYTLLALFPTNARLFELNMKELDEKDSLALLKKWGLLNLGRPLLASAAVLSISIGVSLLKK